jgi:hypothetical protein
MPDQPVLERLKHLQNAARRATDRLLESAPKRYAFGMGYSWEGTLIESLAIDAYIQGVQDAAHSEALAENRERERLKRMTRKKKPVSGLKRKRRQ